HVVIEVEVAEAHRELTRRRNDRSVEDGADALGRAAALQLEGIAARLGCGKQTPLGSHRSAGNLSAIADFGVVDPRIAEDDLRQDHRALRLALRLGWVRRYRRFANQALIVPSTRIEVFGQAYVRRDGHDLARFEAIAEDRLGAVIN